MATDLATLLQQIPLAEDGKLITRDYHNSLRAALLALAAGVGSGAAPAKQIALLPRFLRADGEKAAWMQDGSKAVSSARGSGGILPIDLRDNEHIESVVLSGRLDRVLLDQLDGRAEFALVQQSVLDPERFVRSRLDARNVKLGAGGEFSATIEATRGNIEIGGLADRSGKTTTLAYLHADVPEGAQVELWGVVVLLK